MHHNDFANYILDCYLFKKEDCLNYILVKIVKNCILNFEQNESSFCYLCEYDYYIPVNILLKENDIDILVIQSILVDK